MNKRAAVGDRDKKVEGGQHAASHASPTTTNATIATPLISACAKLCCGRGAYGRLLMLMKVPMLVIAVPAPKTKPHKGGNNRIL